MMAICTSNMGLPTPASRLNISLMSLNGSSTMAVTLLTACMATDASSPPVRQASTEAVIANSR